MAFPFTSCFLRTWLRTSVQLCCKCRCAECEVRLLMCAYSVLMIGGCTIWQGNYPSLHNTAVIVIVSTNQDSTSFRLLPGSSYCCCIRCDRNVADIPQANLRCTFVALPCVTVFLPCPFSTSFACFLPYVYAPGCLYSSDVSNGVDIK
jgi:hypothetical protein